MTDKDVKIYLASVLGLGGIAALTLGGLIGRQLPPIWPFIIFSAATAGVAIWKFYREGICSKQKHELAQKAEQQVRIEAEAQRVADFNAAGLQLELARKSQIIKLTVEELVDYADDLDGESDKALLLSAMGESVSRLIDLREHLFMDDTGRFILDLQMVMERIDAAKLGQRVTAVRLRSLLSKGGE